MERSTVIEQKDKYANMKQMKQILENLQIIRSIKSNVMNESEKKAFINQAPDHSNLQKKR